MNKFLALLSLSLGFSASLNGQLPPEDKTYRLVFSDEFDSTYPATVFNPLHWDRTPGWNQPSNKTLNVSYCYPGDTTTVYWDKAYIIRDPSDTTTVNISGGICRLLTRTADYDGEVWTWPDGQWKIEKLPFRYTTGALYSKKKFRYGYFEIRFRLPQAPAEASAYSGFGPNFWMFNANPGGGKYSEIDIFEIDAADNTYTCNAHYSSGKLDKITSKAYFRNKKISGGPWHTAAVWWTPKKIVYYLDGKRIHRFPSRRYHVPPDSLLPMQIFIDINSPATNFCRNFSEETVFPYTYEIDYVRIYQSLTGYRRDSWLRRMMGRKPAPDPNERRPR